MRTHDPRRFGALVEGQLSFVFRPFFGELSSEAVLLGNPTVCVQGDRVTHLVFPVLR
jgi:hypothetical protein